MARQEKGGEGGLSTLLRNFTDLLSKLEEVAQSGEPVVKTGSVDLGSAGREKKPARGIFGFSVDVGLGGKHLKVEPFGNLRPDAEGGESVMDERREPLVDVFDEDDRVLVVAEMPGIDCQDIHVDLEDRTLTLTAEHEDRKYQKVIEVPAGIDAGRIEVACKNGLAEISCPRR